MSRLRIELNLSEWDFIPFKNDFVDEIHNKRIVYRRFLCFGIWMNFNRDK